MAPASSRMGRVIPFIEGNMLHSFRIQCPAYYKKLTCGVNKNIAAHFTLHRYHGDLVAV